MSSFLFLLKFSLRNLFRNPKRTLIMVTSLALGTGFIIWDLSFANSGSKEVMKTFLQQYAGRYHITHKEYYKDGNAKDFNNYRVITDKEISNKELIARSTQRVTAPIFVSGDKKTLGVLLSGLEVDKELKLTTLSKAINSGRFLASNGSREIILGKKLAHRIEVKLGDKVAVLGQALDGSVANDLLTVVGFLDFGGGDLEEGLAFTQIDTARDLMSVPYDAYHQRVSFDMDGEELPDLPGLSVTKWDELLPEIGVSVRFIDNFTWVVSVIIVLVMSLGLSNTLLITFLEREHEFQSLNILGAKSSWIGLSLMLEVFVMGTIAIFLGAIIGNIAIIYCYYNPIDLQIFTGGKPIILGGMTIQPLVRLYPVPQYYWQVPIMIYFFLGLTMIYPLVRVIRRSKNAI